MDLLSRIASWLGENEATISAVVGIAVLTGIVLAGLRSLVRRRGEAAQATAPSATTTEPTPAAAEAPAADLDPLTVPGFEGRPAIAVLPFDDLSADHDQEYFADGIAEDLITRLSAWRDFPVIARNSSFTYKGKPVDVKQVSRELGVRYVVEGSVRKTGDRVRISAQLIDATTGGHVWAESYDQELEDIFTIQDEITTGIATAIGVKLVQTEEERTARQPSQDLTAYDLLMRGRWYGWRGWMEGNFQLVRVEARSLFTQAIEIDPRFATAFAWLAWTYLADWYSPSDSPAQALEEAERGARRSILLDPELAVGHAVLGHLHQIRGEPNEALGAVRRAIESDPTFSASYQYMGFILAEVGEPEEAMAALEKGMRLSPRDPLLSEFLRAKGRAHFAAQRYEEAAECAKQSIAQGRTILGVAWQDLAAYLAHLGHLDEAAAAFREGEVHFVWTSTETELRRMFSYFKPDLLERYIDGLRKAGLKE
jgi:TolB-like protein